MSGGIPVHDLVAINKHCEAKLFFLRDLLMYAESKLNCARQVDWPESLDDQEVPVKGLADKIDRIWGIGREKQDVFANMTDRIN
jgi:hypothetical protein